jgi:hypothetical protein
MNLELQALPCNLKKTWDFSAVVSASVQPWSILKKTALVHIKKKLLNGTHQSWLPVISVTHILWHVEAKDSYDSYLLLNPQLSRWNQHDCSWHVLFFIISGEPPMCSCLTHIRSSFKSEKLYLQHISVKTSMTKRQDHLENHLDNHLKTSKNHLDSRKGITLW